MTIVELTPEKLAHIKKKAKAAEGVAPSPWTFSHTSGEYRFFYEVRDSGDYQVVHDMSVEEGEHIAAADPATVLAMVHEIELLKKRLSWFPAHMKEIIDLAILAHTGGMADPRKDHCSCDHTVGYYCEYCAVLHALISCKNATESEAGQ